MAALLVMLARCVLVATLLAAPWAIGGAELRHQRWLFLGVAIAGVLAWLGCVLNGSARLSRLSSLMLLTGAALIGVGAFQLAPHPHAPELKRAELTEALQVLVGNDSAATARSLSPADTRLQMGRLALALCAFLCGSWLFGERRARHWLWAILAVNGVALVAFGIIQRASWNDKLYWTIPLQLGGQPFAAFVNRNNAAEYLSMCLSGVLGLWAWRRTLTELPAWSGKARDGKTGWFERIPATPWAVLILMLFGGVFATLSRGGALSAAAAILVIGVWAGATGRARTILLPLIGIVVAAGVWIAVSQQRDQLQARLSTVTRSLATDDRVGHWTDMVRALQDFSPWGSGLGAYRYANKPYERRKSEIWFDSADNQYLELLVDGGAVAGIVIVGALVLALVAAERWRRCGSLGEALAAGYLLIAIGLQSITNCWWMVSANVLTLATLAGALSSPARELDDLSMSPLDKVRQLIESRGGVVSAAVAGLCVLIVAGLGLYEVTLAAESAEFRRRVPDDELRGALADVELDGLLILGEQLAVRRSDDAELHAALARLHYYRYRNQAAATLDAVAPARWSEAVRWERTSPSSLFATLARYRQIGDASAVARFRDAPTVKADFEPISEHLLAARRSCPILPRLGLYEAIHELLNEGDPSLPLRREAALSPASVTLLLSLARSAEMIDDAELFETCLARCLALDPAATTLYVETARRRLSEPQIVERLLPAVPRQLLDFAEAARSSAGRAQALQRASDLIDSERVPEPERLWHRARIARLSEDLAGAVELFAQSVEADPIEPNRRLDYASALFAHGDRAGALEQLATARRLAQEDRRVQSRADELDDLLKAPRR